MKRIFVCSPLKGDIKENVKNAIDHSRYVAEKGYIPYTPHIYFTQFLDDNKPHERIVGIEEGKKWLMMCDEIWVFGNIISRGMMHEINLAKELHIKIRRVQ